MEMQSRPSGLVVPKPPPEPPPRSPVEIQDPEARETARDGLNLLWDAMDLSSGDDGWLYHQHLSLWQFVGEELLGDDCPDREVLT